MTVASTARILSGVKLGNGCEVGEFVVIGVPSLGMVDDQPATVIGDGALIRSHTVIYAGNTIATGFSTGHAVMLRECNKIGSDVSIGTGSVVEHHVRIGNGVRIHSQAFVPEFSVLEDGCWLGPNVVLTNARYPGSRRAKKTLCGPVIGRSAKIGANSTVLPGVHVGEMALIGAGSVVTRDVPPWAVVAGNPARVIKMVRDLRELDNDNECPYAL